MIRFDQVTKTYRGTQRPALDDITLEILKGEFVFLVGQSGSGKSSFLRLVLKEEKPSRGRIHVLGQSLTTLSTRKVPYFRRNLGVVFQDFRLLTNKNVFDNVAFTLQVIGKSRAFIQQAVPDVLKLVGLAGKQHRMPHELSGGEQQRVAIARAVVNNPAVLLADEPTGNLDPATSVGIMALLSSINANGTTVVMATHDATIVDQMQRRVIELVAGRIVRDERGGGYQTQAVPIQRMEEQLAATGRVPDAEAIAEDLQLAVLQGRRPTRDRAAATAFETGAVPVAPTVASTAPPGAARPAATAERDPSRAADPAAGAADPEPTRSASEALAQAVSRATSALPVRQLERERHELNDPSHESAERGDRR